MCVEDIRYRCSLDPPLVRAGVGLAEVAGEEDRLARVRLVREANQPCPSPMRNAECGMRSVSGGRRSGRSGPGIELGTAIPHSALRIPHLSFTCTSSPAPEPSPA